MTLRTMPSTSSNRRPRCLCVPETYSPRSTDTACPSKRSRDSNSISSQASSHFHITSPIPRSPALKLIHKRHRTGPVCRPQLSHQRGPGPPFHIIKSLSLPPSSFCSTIAPVSITTLSANHDLQLTQKRYAIGLPDEVLVAIFRFVDHASKLARLRTVCKQWCKVIDETPDVWRMVSFKNADFSQPVVQSRSLLKLGSRPGEKAVTTAARSGNEWARFLKKIVFDRHTLRAVTIPQPIASLLVSGERPIDARPFPPWVGRTPKSNGTWVAIHAARHIVDSTESEGDNDMNVDPAFGAANGSFHGSPVRGEMRETDLAKLPFGAMVGMIHVRDAFQTNGPDGESSAPNWIWKIDRAVSLKKPIRCAGFVGLWSISGFLTDLLVNAMHKQ